MERVEDERQAILGTTFKLVEQAIDTSWEAIKQKTFSNQNK
jgi:hypothetical protein